MEFFSERYQYRGIKMAVNFTNSPSNGDTITADGRTYTFSSSTGKWDVTASPGATLLSLSDVGSDGSNGQVLTTDGSGSFTFTTISASPTGYSSSGDDVTISADADNNSGNSSIIFQLDGTEFARFQKRWDNGLIFGVSEIPTTGSIGGTELTLLRSGQTGVVSISNAEPNAIFGKPSSQNDVIHIKSGTTDVGAIGIIKDDTLTNRGMYLRGGVLTETVIRLEASTQALTPAVQSGSDYAARSNNTTDLGLSDARWKDLYMGNDILVLDSVGVSRFLYDKGSDQLGSRALNYIANVVDAVNFKVNGAQGSDGQVLTSTGSGVAWEDAAGGGGTSVTVSDTAPSSPSAGDLWWSSSTLAPYIYYADGSSNQWVEFATRAGGLSSIVADTTPQLGGNLDVNGNDIVSVSNGNIDIKPDGTGNIILDNHTWPNADGNADQVLKTNGSGVLGWVDQSSGGASVSTSDTAPSSPSDGDLWFDTTDLTPYIYYADGSSNQWVEFANPDSGTISGVLSDLTNVSSTSPSSGQVLKWSGSEWAPAADSTGTGGIASVVADTSPQLGGALDVNGQDIVSTSNGDIELDPNGSGVVIFKGNATKGAGQFKLNCENNSHGITIKGPPHSAAASYTLTLPNDDGSANQVLKTDGSGVLSWTTPASAGATSIDDLSDAVYNSTALSLFLGANAGAAVTNSASANVAVGVNAGDSITSANMNVLLGYNAGNAITTGSKNIVIGGQAYNATSSNGSHNILIGYNAEATSTSTNNEMTIGTASGDGLINNVRIPGVDFTMNTTALHYGAEIRADGDVVAYYSSDERLKENIEIIPDALSKVQQIRGVTFDWTDEYLEKQGGEDGYFHRKHDSGVIAQDVEKVLPELVAERPDGTKAVRYEKLVAVLIEAVKELKQEIEELKGEK